MADASTPVRKAPARALRRRIPLHGAVVACILMASGFASFALARGDVNDPRGSTAGLLSPDPHWSAGLQLGNLGATGFTAQTVGFRGGAVNGGLGFAEGGLVANADYVIFLGEGLSILKVKKSKGYNGIRGRFLPYVGGGAQVGRGISLRVPAGVQYGMIKDPFNFYAGLTLMAGSFLSDRDFGVHLGVAVGARLLL